MPLPRVVIEGRLASEPELRFLPSGAAMCNFRVASSQRKQNEQTGQWEDDKSCFLTVTAWRDMAENVADSMHQGDPVVVSGRLSQREYERDGAKQSVYQVDADSVGPDLRWASARVQRTQRSGAPQQGQQQGQDQWSNQQPNAPQRPAQRPQQPQQTYPSQSQQGWGNTPSYDEPPPF